MNAIILGIVAIPVFIAVVLASSYAEEIKNWMHPTKKDESATADHHHHATHSGHTHHLSKNLRLPAAYRDYLRRHGKDSHDLHLT